MPEDPPLAAQDLAAALKGLLEHAVTQAPLEESVFARRLRAHFGADPMSLPIVAEDFEGAEQPNLQRAIDAYLAVEGRSAELIGVSSEHKRYMGASLTDLFAPSRRGLMGGAGATEGPVEYVRVPVHGGEMLTCLESGLYLIREPARRLALMVNGPGERRGFGKRLQIEVMAGGKEDAERLLAELRTSMRKLNVYRGHVVSLSLHQDHTLQVHFHSLPSIDRTKIVLPAGVLERVEQHTVGFTRNREKLLRAGRHLKRGILLHGPPGTGKTLTAMYLASQMRDYTVLLLTGRGVGLIPHACAMARLLEPSIVILEDVDLVAEERTRPGADCLPLLFELLNEMDGLAEDTDVVFLLTSNRPDLLEPALAARPGRVDQAIEIPLPDQEGRRRLFELYARGLTVRAQEMDRLVARTEGVSGAFIRELFRKAAVLAADGDGALVVEDRHLESALHDLVVAGGELTRSLLGARRGPPPAP
jgi:hypothetical protein